MSEAKEKAYCPRHKRPTIAAYIRSIATLQKTAFNALRLPTRSIKCSFSYIATKRYTASAKTPTIAITANGFK